MCSNKVLIFVLGLACSLAAEYDDSEIHGYHFHTYFFQNNVEITQEALEFR
jgi:hypothetical protein